MHMDVDAWMAFRPQLWFARLPGSGGARCDFLDAARLRELLPADREGPLGAALAQIEAHGDHDHRHADVLQALLDQERRLVVEHAAEEGVFLEDELPGDDEGLRVLRTELRAEPL